MLPATSLVLRPALVAAVPLAASQLLPILQQRGLSLSASHADSKRTAAPRRNELAELLHTHLDSIFNEPKRESLNMSPAAAALAAEAGELSIMTGAEGRDRLRTSAAAVAARLNRKAPRYAAADLL